MKVMSDELPMRIAHADAARDEGKLNDALVEYQAIVAEFPDLAEGRYKLGAVYDRLKQTSEAERCYREALSLWHDYPEANNNLGVILAARGELESAEWHYRTALAERPDYLEPHLNLGGLLHETSRLLEAQYYAMRAQLLNPESSAACARRGQAVRAMGRISEGTRHFQRAVELDPKSAAALTDLGSCYWQLGRHRDAETALLSALAVVPDFFPAWNNLLLVSNYRLRDREEVFRLHRSFGDIVRKQCGEPESAQVGIRPDPDRRLRVGFLSGDFRRHSVAYFLSGPLGALDRRQFQLFAYYNFRTEDQVTRELKPLFHRWNSIFGLSDQAAADLIRQDKLDILVDLAGHTAAIRPLVLGRRPAPIQVHWIGYPNTTGLDCIDYRLTDAWADPEADGEQFSVEHIWRLPRSFLCYTPSDVAPDPQDPPGLKRGHITFGSFNSRAKLSDECVALWCRVLLATPNSRLVLKSMIGVEDEEARSGLRDLFAAHGIEADRVEVLVRRTAVEDHFSAYHDIDIALDTFPYNGTTTTCEALWMGVPVVSLAGDRHASRVGVSLLNNAGLAELVAENPDEFVRIATELARDPGRLLSLRGSMRERMLASRLMDRRAMGADLGDALREMWQRYCARFPAAMPLEKQDGDQSPELLKLHIGGREAREGWKILDADMREEVDFIGNLTNLSSFADQSCVEVYCSHVLEHVGQTEMLDTLNGLHRILAPGGRLYISVPDLDVLVWLFANPASETAQRFQIMRMMFGGQMDEFDFHKIGLNFDFMVSYCQDVGFTSVEHVESFGLFDDTSNFRVDGHLISLNLIVTK